MRRTAWTALVVWILAAAAAILGATAGLTGTARAKGCYMEAWRVIRESVQVDGEIDTGALAVEAERWNRSGTVYAIGPGGFLFAVLSSGDTADPAASTVIQFDPEDP